MQGMRDTSLLHAKAKCCLALSSLNPTSLRVFLDSFLRPSVSPDRVLSKGGVSNRCCCSWIRCDTSYEGTSSWVIGIGVVEIGDATEVAIGEGVWLSSGGICRLSCLMYNSEGFAAIYTTVITSDNSITNVTNCLADIFDEKWFSFEISNGRLMLLVPPVILKLAITRFLIFQSCWHHKPQMLDNEPMQRAVKRWCMDVNTKHTISVSFYQSFQCKVCA